MKKGLLFAFTAIILLACEKAPEEVRVESVSLSQSTAEMLIGESVQLSATVLPSNATDKTVIWASSKQSVATITESGRVTAIAEGVSTITASASGKSATCMVTVSKGYVAVSSVTLNKQTLSLEKGASETLSATVLPADATNKTVTWTTSNSSIANVDQSGKVTAIGGGSATITAKADNQTATCTVAVTVPVTSISLDRESLTLEEEGTTVLVATIEPADATDKSITWSSSNTAIVTVDNAGKVTAVKEGSAVITAKAGAKEAKCAVTVQKKVIPVSSITLSKNTLSLVKGASETLMATVSPEDATDKTVTWSSSNAEVASVDENGKVTAKASGEAIITAKAGEKSATCTVTVIVPVESISLNTNTLSLVKGESATLTATVKPDDASDKTVTWGSTNSDVAEVDQQGKVVAKSSGKATITSSAGGKTASCTVSVTVPIESITLNKTALELYEGKSEVLIATIKPDDATDSKVTWGSSNTGVATVDEEGKVTAIAAGETNIIAMAGGKTATCKVVVKKDTSAEAIVFADSMVKEKLVAAFDTNGDGELSYGEAAAVTSIKGVFGDDPRGFKSFNEFQYFTSVTSVTQRLFADWRSLSTIHLPDSITELEAECFEGCSSLKTITLPKHISMIRYFVFRGCSSLEIIDLHDVSSLAYGMFSECRNLTTIKNLENIHSFSDCSLQGCSKLKGDIIVDGSVGVSTFDGCANITSIVLTENVKRINSHAFYACSSLKTITIPKSVYEIGMYAFAGCSGLTSIRVESVIPPKLSVDAFRGSKCPIYVPAESVNAYKEDGLWRDYADRIQAISE